MSGERPDPAQHGARSNLAANGVAHVATGEASWIAAGGSGAIALGRLRIRPALPVVDPLDEFADALHGVETTGDRCLPIGRHGNRPHRSAMTAKLGTTRFYAAEERTNGRQT